MKRPNILARLVALIAIVLAPAATLRGEETASASAACPPGPSAELSMPVVVRKYDPKYTEAARAAGIYGRVFLRAVVGVSGRAEQIRVVKSLGGGLDENAVAAVSTWEFRPATWKGQPCAAVASVDLSFHPGRDRRRPPELVAAIRTVFAEPKKAEGALEIIQRGVEQNLPMANRALGGFLVDGKVIKKDVERGLRLLREAAMEGDRSALYSVGKLHVEGRYLERNPQLGAVLIARSADMGFPKAAQWAALQHQEGGLLPKSPSLAERYFRRCASAHVAACKTALAEMLLGREPVH